MADMMREIDPAECLAARQAEIAKAMDLAGRDASQAPVTLVAVSKKHPADHVRRALTAGHRVFGENRVQEAQAKWPELRAAFPDLTLHLVGPLQSNKAKEAVALFDVIETVDRPKIARALASEIQKQGRAPTLFVQVNTGEEAQKAGVTPADTPAFIHQCREEFGLAIGGLMCIPPQNAVPAPHFTLLARLAADNDLPCLSMGMSADYLDAVKLGATHVRLGTAIFGPRPEV
ncbi:MAG: YggS family pyridoxal phosphate-dependent enzyme [Pseudomonadota bacterium]